MFVSKKKYETDMEYLRKEVDRLSENYWALRNKHERLMNHLGLEEHTRSGVEIRPWRDPLKDSLKG